MHAMARKKAKRIRTPQPRTQRSTVAPPTVERLDKSMGNFEIAKDGDIKGRWQMRDAPLEMRRHRGHITEFQYQAGRKFYHHWFYAGLKDRYAALNLTGVFGGGSSIPMPVTEMAQHHYDQYQIAVRALGMDAADIVQKICCEELYGFEVARERGYEDGDYGATKVLKVFDDGLNTLCKLWGLY